MMHGAPIKSVKVTSQVWPVSEKTLFTSKVVMATAQPNTNKKKLCTRAFSLLDQQGIRIKRFRADSASYQQKVISLVEGTSQHFYIRAVRCATME